MPWLFRPVRFPELILTDIIKFLEKIDDMSAQENDAENIPKDRRAPLCVVTVWGRARRLIRNKRLRISHDLS